MYAVDANTDRTREVKFVRVVASLTMPIAASMVKTELTTLTTVKHVSVVKDRHFHVTHPIAVLPAQEITRMDAADVFQVMSFQPTCSPASQLRNAIGMMPSILT